MAVSLRPRYRPSRYFQLPTQIRQEDGSRDAFEQAPPAPRGPRAWPDGWTPCDSCTEKVVLRFDLRMRLRFALDGVLDGALKRRPQRRNANGFSIFDSYGHGEQVFQRLDADNNRVVTWQDLQASGFGGPASAPGPAPERTAPIVRGGGPREDSRAQPHPDRIFPRARVSGLGFISVELGGLRFSMVRPPKLAGAATCSRAQVPAPAATDWALHYADKVLQSASGAPGPSVGPAGPPGR